MPNGLDLNDDIQTPIAPVTPDVVTPEPIVQEEAPSPISEYQELLEELEKEKKRRKSEKEKLKYKNLAGQVLDALTQYSVRTMQAKAQMASPTVMQFKDPESTHKEFKADTETNVLQEALDKAKLRKQLDPTLATPKTAAEFQQTDWINEKTGQPLIQSKVTGIRYTHDKEGNPVKFKGTARRKIPKILEDKEGRKYRLLQDGSKEYLDQQETGKYTMWKDMTPDQQDYTSKIGKEYRTETKPIDDFETTIEGLDSFVAANLDGTVGAIQRQLARTVGQEKGVMTDRDVAAFGGTDRVTQMIAQYAHAKVHGGMTDEIQKNFRNILKVAAKNIARKRAKINAKYVRPMKFRLGDRASDAFIHEALGMEQKEKKQEKKAGTPAPYGDIMKRKGRTYKWNSTRGKYQLFNQ
jgi:hypothetical protein